MPRTARKRSSTDFYHVIARGINRERIFKQQREKNNFIRLLLKHLDKHDVEVYAVTYGEFMYQADSWKYPRRVVFKIEKPYGRLTHMYTFIVTNMDMEPYQIIRFSCLLS